MYTDSHSIYNGLVLFKAEYKEKEVIANCVFLLLSIWHVNTKIFSVDSTALILTSPLLGKFSTYVLLQLA